MITDYWLLILFNNITSWNQESRIMTQQQTVNLLLSSFVRYVHNYYVHLIVKRTHWSDKKFFYSSQGLAKLLSQVLLRGICERNYEKPLHVLLSSPIISSTSSLRSTSKTESKAATINVISSKNAMFPLKPHLYSGDRWINPFFIFVAIYL